jgi:error-prone DNA polymerase
VEPGIAEELWRQVASFGGYSFCKAHSASYALVSFQAAYLRAHYPAELMAAVLSNYGGYYATIAYISEAMRMGLELRRPDVNESEIAYTGYTDPQADREGRQGWLRVGLCQVRGLSEGGRDALVAERRKNGPFTGFEDLMERVGLKPAEIEALIRCGALDGLGEGTRPELMWRALVWQKSDRRAGTGGSGDGGGRFRTAARPARPAPAVALTLPLDLPLAEGLPAAPQYDEATILAYEAETLGYLVSAHPLELYQEAISAAAERKGPPMIEGRELEAHVGKWVRLVGWMVTAKPIHTVNDEVMEFISFEDTTALYEVTVFPRPYRRYASQLMTRGPFLLTGTVEEEWGAITVTLERLQVLGRGELPRAERSGVVGVPGSGSQLNRAAG